MLDAQCMLCRFWQESRNDAARGSCRRNAPSPANQAALFHAEILVAVADLLARQFGLTWPEGIEGEPTETTNATMFPRTYHDDWCGEFLADA